MSADLDDMLAGVGVRFGKERDDGAIDRPVVHADRRERRAPRFEPLVAVNAASATSRARGPLIRTTPMPPRPAGVAIATMVSEGENIDAGEVAECDVD